jgi:hypothetical protein
LRMSCSCLGFAGLWVGYGSEREAKEDQLNQWSPCDGVSDWNWVFG